MGNLIELPRPNLREIRLEDAISEAESIGKVSMDQSYDRSWRVSIMFNNSRGSTIFAKGQDRALLIALGNAVNEARELGAGSTP
jgi:hypothetical protein